MEWDLAEGLSDERQRGAFFFNGAQHAKLRITGTETGSSFTLTFVPNANTKPRTTYAARWIVLADARIVGLKTINTRPDDEWWRDLVSQLIDIGLFVAEARFGKGSGKTGLRWASGTKLTLDSMRLLPDPRSEALQMDPSFRIAAEHTFWPFMRFESLFQRKHEDLPVAIVLESALDPGALLDQLQRGGWSLYIGTGGEIDDKVLQEELLIEMMPGATTTLLR